MENTLVLENISRTFKDGSLVLKDIHLSLAQGTKLSVLGPSGSGKTTLLRIIAGLEKPDAGRVIFKGQPINNIAVHKRNFGMMFQDFALFPHLNVFDNIAFGLKMKGMDKAEIEPAVQDVLAMTGMEDFKTRRIDELSGGEKQRVALARTLAPRPDLLMFDEPLSSLDRVLRKKLLTELISIMSTLNIITIFVTHDHEEAFAAGNMVIIMDQGNIRQKGTPDQLMNHPADPWVREFLGI